MKVKYDKEVDIIYLKLSDKRIAESDEDKKGVIIDYSNDEVVGIEILDASKISPSPLKMEYEVG